jgi:uncharacterized protein
MILFTLSVLPTHLAVCRLSASSALPTDIADLPFMSITRTEDELSLVVPEGNAPQGAKVEMGWRAIKLHGPIDFNLTGVLAGLAGILAKAKIPIFALSTYDTDYLLLKAGDLERAVSALRKEGHRVEF